MPQQNGTEPTSVSQSHKYVVAYLILNVSWLVILLVLFLHGDIRLALFCPLEISAVVSAVVCVFTTWPECCLRGKMQFCQWLRRYTPERIRNHFFG
ncbi:hypothetical protein F5883DRAFT_575970 [Diaporthe sp. PMI_573]|nr:hypothetical protein F5883DRAFT_575970 [Diaporthaceae sp. PMI_573]